MAQDQTKKEALFNEVKGSLFEFLVARRLAAMNGDELSFVKSIDQNYLNVLSQQDRMVRQFYPEMLSFLNEVSMKTVSEIASFFKESPSSPQLTGKFSSSSQSDELHEADLLVKVKDQEIPLSLKLNKKNAFVNTKSGGIKSFFQLYFPFIDLSIQQSFNQFVDQEFTRMAVELHAHNDMEFSGSFSAWVREGKSELPGELTLPERAILKSYYARIANEMHSILSKAQSENPEAFSKSLAPLMGFSSKEIIQVVCFHDFKSKSSSQVNVHPYEEISGILSDAKLNPFQNISSVEIYLKHWTLQIRVKPMNKFTTTAIKINCSVKVMPSDA